MEIIKFISAEAIKQAFLDAIEQYQMFKAIQDGQCDLKKYLSTVKLSGHLISNSGIEASEQWRLQMDMAQDNTSIISVLNDFLVYNGANIKNYALKRANYFNFSSLNPENKSISSEKLTSLTTFVYLAVIHQACFFEDNNNDLNKYISSVAKVKTGNQIYFNTGEALVNFINKSPNNIDKLFINEAAQKPNLISESDKINTVLTYLLSQTVNGKMFLKSLFSERQQIHYKKLAEKLASQKLSTSSDYGLPQGEIRNFNKLMADIQKAIQEYAKKFKRRIDTGEKGWNKSTLTNPINISTDIPYVNTIISLYKGVANILLETNSYGFTQYHGVDGQMRAFLFSNVCKNILIYINNINDFLYLDTKDGDLKKYSMILKNYLNTFLNSYREFLTTIPNKSGSLGTFLNIWAEPTSLYSYTGPNRSKLTSYNNTKLSKDIK
ncbi:hypothetical protein [Francisella uliginis]|uniref:Uncharacterized protein n=1 Tax=Francisella uliginis TaxID=573570 RepID=A0A1L4BRD6_9GAMM|nr:hypothetical protein [Francisella uliginis]API86416.1 hypothetical protein F7310_03185 [Francisella uliginis]